jgi:hypothetical protein
MAHRQLKAQVLGLLQTQDWPAALERLGLMPARQVVNPLFGLLYHAEPLIRWRAVSAMGRVVCGLADETIESARIVMRRLMWNLNDESGGIGWGSPEAMGDILARHAGLAGEYGCILVSYADPDGNFLEHPGLQPGVLWALGRLGRVHPEVVCPAVDFIKPHLHSPVPNLRGMAVWALQPFVDDRLGALLRLLVSDPRHLQVYIDEALKDRTIGDLAAEALAGLKNA